jgi:Glycosyl hydrolases family 25
MHYGIDVSDNNPHPINVGALYSYLATLGGGQPFVIVKATQGSGYVNPDFLADIAAFKAGGFAVGAYLMDQGNVAVAAEEAKFKLVAGGLPQFDDDELPSGLTQAQYVEHLAGLIAEADSVQYFNQSYVQEGFHEGAGLWLAQYNGFPGSTSYPCLIHQYTDAGTVPGAAGQFDLNFFMGSEAQFAATFKLILIPPALKAGPNMATSVSTGGQLAVRADGGVFNYGGSEFFGSLPGLHIVPNAPIVGIAATKTGKGYWLVGSDGGIFCFGDAEYHGSTPANKGWLTPVVGIALDEAQENGYVIFADDGGPEPATYYCNDQQHYA